MGQKYLYLFIDLFCITPPLLFSFYPGANFSRKWKYLWPAILVSGVVFVSLDEWFTRLGVWGFNPLYVSGIYVGSLPIEEILFFVCIPYACVFTYEVQRQLVAKDHLRPYQRSISLALIILCFGAGAFYSNRLYTSSTLLTLGLCIAWIQFVSKESFLGRFYFTYLILLVPFFVVNGILTGFEMEEPVVWYNNAENAGVRIATIPVEDIFYGMLLILLNVWIFERFQRKSVIIHHPTEVQPAGEQ